MEIAILYLLIYALLAMAAIVAITLLVVAIIIRMKHKEAGNSILKGFIAVLLLGCMVTVWLFSHRSYPLINDWAFLGKDISTIEQKYDGFRWYSKGEDGSGYAVLMTEKITGISMYDSGNYSCYYMEFDQTGKIVKVYCSRPIGG